MSLIEIASGAESYIGSMLDNNQDTLRIFEPEQARQGSLYAVADGIGGYSYGEIASGLAVDTFFSTFYSRLGGKASANLYQAMQAANLAVCHIAQSVGVRMGTTLSAANLVGNSLTVAHIGDSRVYLVRGQQATCLTRDHTKVGDLVAMKVLSPDKVRTHDQRSLLNRCLGAQLFIQPEVKHYTVQQGDTIILCSDGVWSVIDDHEFGHMAYEFGESRYLSQILIDMALNRGSDDNLSAIAVHVKRLDLPDQRSRKFAFSMMPLLRRL